jgi:hypothetical protein
MIPYFINKTRHEDDLSSVMMHIILIALMMEAVNTSETSVSFYQTTLGNIPEDSHLYICHRENLKSQQLNMFRLLKGPQ